MMVDNIAGAFVPWEGPSIPRREVL
jgi:hypothetical protein